MAVELSTVEFMELGLRNEAGFCRLPNGERVLIDDQTWAEWHRLGIADYYLVIKRDEGFGPVEWKDWAPNPDGAFKSM